MPQDERIVSLLIFLLVLIHYTSAWASDSVTTTTTEAPSLVNDARKVTCAEFSVCDPRVDEMDRKDVDIIWNNILNQDKILRANISAEKSQGDGLESRTDHRIHQIISSKIVDYSRKKSEDGENQGGTAHLYYGGGSANFRSASNIDMITKIFHELFLHPRNDEFSVELKNKTRNGIIERLSHYTLETQVQEFFAKAPNGSVIPGSNIIGVIPGRRRGQPGDEIVLVGAHYDTDAQTPGVDDNGSGVVGMLEVARILSPKMGILNQTVMFVAFDHEEKGILGSLAFVNNYLIPHELKGKRAKFTGAYIMEMILNYDPSPNSQILPLDIIAGVPESVVWLNLNSNKGDFVSVWSRRVLDWPLWHTFNTAWNEANNNKTDPKLYSMDPAIPRNPLLLSTVRYRAFFRSDHAAFWTYRTRDYDESLSAVLITDMGPWRGNQRACYHEFCDDQRLLTPSNLDFMKRITDAVAQSVSRLAE